LHFPDHGEFTFVLQLFKLNAKTYVITDKW